MIGATTFIGIAFMFIGGFVLPLGVCIGWLAVKKEKITTVLVGALVWFLFAMILEKIPAVILLSNLTPIGKALSANTFAFVTIGVLLAGIFEETGRFLAFKTVLKKRRNRETSVSYGIGHGGVEAMLIVGLSAIQVLIYALMINSGSFQTVIDQAAATGADVSALEALPDQIRSVTAFTALLSILERISAMAAHVAFSIIVFYGVRESKIGYYFLAVLLHALYDVPAGLYQKGLVDVYVVEAVLFVASVILLVTTLLLVYNKMTAEKAADKIPEEASAS